MKGQMQEVPLTVQLIMQRAIDYGYGRQVVSATPTGVIRHSWPEVGHRAASLAGVLSQLGVAPGGRVATFAWNSHRHVELHLGVPSARRVLHPVNLRLSDEHIQYLVERAGDELAFVDAAVTPLVARLRRHLPIRQYVIMDDGSEVDAAFEDCPRYEDLLAANPDDGRRQTLQEDDAAWICSTSGTTGRPKLVVTSQRSVYLHALIALTVDSHGISREDVVMPATPMFHVAAWGAPYTCAYAPASLVLTGRDTSPEALAALIEAERVTVGFGVPTIWMQLEAAYEEHKHDLSSLRMIQCGGAPSMRALVDRYTRRGVEYVQSWGMTEMSPIGTSYREHALGDQPDQRTGTTIVGTPSPGVEVRMVDENDVPLPWDGQASGELEVSGPWVIRAYLNPEDDANDARFHDGWLRTGDLGRIWPDGTVEIVDRVKDLIKSGGEWISSIDLEQEFSQHPDVAEVAVVAVADERWGERPAALIVPRAGAELDPDVLRTFLSARVPRWWLPETIAIVTEIPKTGVGKYDKRAARVLLATTLNSQQKERTP